MATTTTQPTGTFCWVDLGTTDQEAAKKFYSEVFGWTANDIPVGPGSTYSMMQKDGKNAAAISTMQKEQKASGMPPVWNSYIMVDDVAASTKKATGLGAQVVMPPMDVMDAGKMAVMKDPSGAYVSFWQAGNHKGAEVVGGPGAISWNELLTKDLDKAKKFYTGLFGWTAEVMPMPGAEYTIFKNGENFAGGMFAIDPAWGPVPPNWMVYFGVENCAKSSEKIKSLGGKILMGPQSAAGVGIWSTCQDPQGGTFSILEPEKRA